jgi:hypothetical protein
MWDEPSFKFNTSILLPFREGELRISSSLMNAGRAPYSFPLGRRIKNKFFFNECGKGAILLPFGKAYRGKVSTLMTVGRALFREGEQKGSSYFNECGKGSILLPFREGEQRKSFFFNECGKGHRFIFVVGHHDFSKYHTTNTWPSRYCGYNRWFCKIKKARHQLPWPLPFS